LHSLATKWSVLIISDARDETSSHQRLTACSIQWCCRAMQLRGIRRVPALPQYQRNAGKITVFGEYR
jgi:hypothetical protein